MVDAFASYKHRATCNISSLDLHTPFGPLCGDRAALLTAMSSGGRIGMDAPYMPRGCDMRWFGADEACAVLARFERVIVLGDSMMRHVVGSLNVLIRKDLGYGAVTDWNFSPQERYFPVPSEAYRKLSNDASYRKDCFCHDQFDVKACSLQGIYKTSDVIKNAPETLSCPADKVDVISVSFSCYPTPCYYFCLTPPVEMMLKHPIPDEEMQRFRALLPAKKPKRPYAFVLGHGLWNNLDLQATVNWIDAIGGNATEAAPWLQRQSAAAAKGKKQRGGSPRSPPPSSSSGVWPRLFVTPNAAGSKKPDQFLVSQGNKALGLFEEAMVVEGAARGIDVVGTWNMTVQATKYDGV